MVEFTGKLVLATVLLALIAALQFFAFVYQGWQLRKTVARMQAQEAITGRSVDEMHRAADAAKESADATRATVLKMDEIAQRQLRAYVGVEFAGVEKLAGHWVVHVTFKNTGQTPAYRFAMCAMSAIDEHPIPVALESDEISPTAYRTTLGRASTLVRAIPVPKPKTQEQVVAIKHGTLARYFYGRVTYRDTFDNERSTTFRMILDPGTNTVLAAPEGNEST